VYDGGVEPLRGRDAERTLGSLSAFTGAAFFAIAFGAIAFGAGLAFFATIFFAGAFFFIGFFAIGIILSLISGHYLVGFLKARQRSHQD
jgi:hypothetical protein